MSKHPSVRIIGVIVVGVPFLLSIFYLLYNSFQIERDLKENLLKICHQRVEGRAADLGNFFSDRIEDLFNLRHSREIAVFFENKALGMSMEYGLKQSLIPIRDLFADLMNRKEVGGGKVYSRLAYISAEGKFLVDTESGKPDEEATALLRQPSFSNSGPGRISMSQDGKYSIVSITHEHKGVYRGQIIGWISPKIIYDHIFGGDKTASSRYFIRDERNGGLLVNDTVSVQPGYFNAIRSTPIGSHNEFSVREKTGDAVNAVAYKVLVPDTTYSLVYLTHAERIYGKLASQNRVATLSLLVIALLAGVAFTVRSMILKTSVNELERRVQKRTADLCRLNESLQSEISEREETMRALEAAEKKYRSIFENAVEGMFQTVPDGRIISANPALARMHGYGTPEEMIADINDLIAQLYVDENRRLEFVRLMEEDGAAYHFEVQTRRKGGMTNWVSINARNVRDENNGTPYYEGSVEDITERKHLESQLLHSQKMEAIGTLAGGIAHDFNNILTAIVGYSDLLCLKIEKDNPVRAYVDRILSSSQKAVNLTQSLLAFSRKQTIDLKPHKAGTLIGGIAELLKRLLTEDVNLEIGHVDNDVVIMADKSQIDQVLMNLATNARDAMPHGGTLVIEATRTVMDNDFIQIHGYGSHGEYVLVSVADTGTGMDENTIKKVFEPFFTTKAEGKGTGLGLSIAYGIIKQHNGYITVESEPGKGTTFRIYLPTVRMKEVHEDTGVPLSMRTGTETILIAEDNKEVRGFLTEVLSVSGYTVVEAMDGEEAFRKFVENKGRIALVISDVVMPGKNGKELGEQIRKIEPNMKILFTSGYTRDIVLFKGIPDKMADFISKPLSSNKLLDKIRELLDEDLDPAN